MSFMCGEWEIIYYSSFSPLGISVLLILEITVCSARKILPWYSSESLLQLSNNSLICWEIPPIHWLTTMVLILNNVLRHSSLNVNNTNQIRDFMVSGFPWEKKNRQQILSIVSGRGDYYHEKNKGWLQGKKATLQCLISKMKALWVGSLYLYCAFLCFLGIFSFFCLFLSYSDMLDFCFVILYTYNCCIIL